LFSLKRHRCRTLKTRFTIIPIKPRAVTGRAGFALLLVTVLKITRFTRLIFTLLVFSRVLFTRMRFSGLKLATLTWFAGLELALFAGLRIVPISGWLAGLVLALVAWLEIPALARRTCVPWLKILFTGLKFAGRLVFLPFIRRLAKASSLGLTLTRSRGTFALAVLVIPFSLIKSPETRVCNAELFLGGSNQTKIMLGVLEKAFRRNMVAGRLSVTPQLHIFFGNILGRTTDLHIRTV
jgi:hypothetical protein